MEIFRTKGFQKAYDKLHAPSKRKVDKALILFIADRSSPALRNHPLKGKLSGLYSFSAAWDLRIVYKEEGNFLTIILIDVGTHNQVYDG